MDAKVREYIEGPPADIRCPKCDGTGVLVEGEYCEERECPRCEGTGEIR